MKITAFTQLVYTATRRIPRGKVSTYAQIAQAIGCPRAVRAVGNALHANPMPGPVPCHRVIRSNGDLGGYALGRERKLAILSAEGISVDHHGRVRPESFFSIPTVTV